MKYTEYGAENRDVMILLHGGGLGPWNYRKEAEVLAQKFHVILPVRWTDTEGAAGIFYP